MASRRPSHDQDDIDAGDPCAPSARQRLDKWMFFARFAKSRSIAAQAIARGHVRINGRKPARASAAVHAGDVLTIVQGKQMRVIQISHLGERRGPAAQAQLLYCDMTPAVKTSAYNGASKTDNQGQTYAR